MNISYSFGIIDLFHYGHLNALKQAHENADLHIFGLVDDKAAKEWLGNVVSDENERMAVLESIVYIDRIMRQKTLDPTDNLKLIRRQYPDAVITVFHGNDWQIIPAEQYVKSINGRLKTFSYYEKLSPENILKKLNERSSGGSFRSSLISTKANTLLALKDRLRLSKIEKISVVTAGEYLKDFDGVYERLCKEYKSVNIVVRSSSKNEDCFEKSNAGHYESVLNVNVNSRQAVKDAIEYVYQSYLKDGGVSDDEQILIQTQTENVILSGVIFTRDIQNNRPYYVISYDDSGKTDTVTGGVSAKQIFLAQDIDPELIPAQWKNVFRSVREIEEILKDILLDIEFAVNDKNEVIIFQVRPFAAGYKWKRYVDTNKIIEIKNKQKALYDKINSSGRMSMYSDMAFWNPAEIIGDNPRFLDYSLYREIITSRAWNKGLERMGYKVINDELMYRFGNKPYISIELSFLALMPEKLNSTLTDKLMEYYLKKLKRDPVLHDKIEFEIVWSCFDFCTKDDLAVLLKNGFSEEEKDLIGQSLYELTIKNIWEYSNILKEDLEALDKLEEIRKDIKNRSCGCKRICVLTDNIRTLLSAINKFGTPQFSRQARFAFIAKSMCRSLSRKGYISESEMNVFMESIQTVATDFNRDFSLYTSGRMNKDEFYEKYGHLRAGTYDIRAERYDKIPFESNNSTAVSFERHINEPLPDEKLSIAIKENGIPINEKDFAAFLKSAFEQREWFKFIFTKSLSDAIELIAEIGSIIGIDRNDMSYLELPEIMAAENYKTDDDIRAFFNSIIEIRKEMYRTNSCIIMPSVICSASDFDFVEMTDAKPNFITDKMTSAQVAVLDGNDGIDISDKIVLLEKADPGYDWIFTKNIRGLITKYGGAASHMAIRAAEFGIPAAIGCGKNVYSYVCENKKIMLDCKRGIIRGEYS